VPVFLVTALLAVAFLFARWTLEVRAHHRRLERLRWRIHVNGIRGKSTVARNVAGMLREAGYVTVAKSTGTEAAVINRHGVDEPIIRRGPPTILEQIEVTKQYVTDDVEALVIECMALKPEYQEVSERLIVRSNIGILTNVREDHQDVMGETLPEIARSLLSTCPWNGLLVTSEQDPALQEVMREVASARGTEVLVADPASVTDAEMKRFDYIAFKDNVAIALAIAERVGIPRGLAMNGIVRAEPDPGVLRVKELLIGGKRVTWANLFAVNDRESMVVAMERLAAYVKDDTFTIGILNNRADRERRALQFADVAAKDLHFDQLVTFGAHEGVVTDRLIANGVPRAGILNLGDDHHPRLEEIVDRMILQQAGQHLFIVGFVNIPTLQAERLLEYFEHEAPAWAGTAPALG